MKTLTRRDFLNRTAFVAGALLPTSILPAADMTNDRAHFVCETCGTQFALTDRAPESCPICLDERQYVGADGQRWTTLDAMRRGEWRNVLQELEPSLISIRTEPRFGIGQRALLVRVPAGNILWDCISFLDAATVRAVRELGGIAAIAISHPHYYSSMVEWSHAFDDAPIYLHEADQRWVMRPDANIRYWRGETPGLADGLTLVRTGGHFDGYQVLHWRDGAAGRGALLSGDQPQICADPNWVSFMYSYPNFIPLNAAAIQRVVAALKPHRYDRIYSAFTPGLVARDAEAVVRRSAERYLRSIAS